MPYLLLVNLVNVLLQRLQLLAVLVDALRSHQTNSIYSLVDHTRLDLLMRLHRPLHELLHQHASVLLHERHSTAAVSGTRSTSNTVNVHRLRLRHVQVDYRLHALPLIPRHHTHLDIQPTRRHVRSQQEIHLLLREAVQRLQTLRLVQVAV